MSEKRTDFAQYADYYDVIYATKDYAAEAAWIATEAGRLGAARGRWLDVGCGTGKHLENVPSERYELFGIDRSGHMADLARQRIPDAHIEIAEATRIPFSPPFNVVSAIFAVVSYLTAPGEFDAFLEEASRMLRPGGVLFFDVWHGPAVLTEGPEPRTQKYSMGDRELVRSSVPEHHVLDHRVDVRYRLAVMDGERLLSEIEEVHRVRYFFPLELREACARHGLTVQTFCPFMDASRSAQIGDWSVAVFATRD